MICTHPQPIETSLDPKLIREITGDESAISAAVRRVDMLESTILSKRPVGETLEEVSD